MSYDAIRDLEETSTVSDLVSEYGLGEQITGEEAPAELQAELLEAVNQFGSLTMDGTVKRRGMWALIRALGIIESQNDLDTSFNTPGFSENERGIEHVDFITTTVSGEDYRRLSRTGERAFLTYLGVVVCPIL